MKDLMLVINPNAGRGGYRDCLTELLRVFHTAGFRSTVFFTDGAGDARTMTANCAGRYDRIVCVGGDGTLSETVEGLMALETEARPVLGYIPMGTTNDCASTLDLSPDPLLAARTAAGEHAIPFDVGRFGRDRCFTYVAAFGAFTEVSYETPQDTKHALGSLAYLLDGMARLGNLTHRIARVEYDDGALEGDFILGAVTNSRSVAGLVRLKDPAGVSLNDGRFELVLVRTPETAIELGTTISDILSNNFSGRNVSLLHSREVRFLFQEPVAWTRDGEAGGVHMDVSCRNVPSAVHILVD